MSTTLASGGRPTVATHANGRPAGLDARVLSLLVAGATHGLIASSLRVSRSAVDTHIATLRRDLDATTAYTIGVHAVRHHRVSPQLVVGHAQGVTDWRGWTVPTVRQVDILRLLAAGASNEQAAARLGLSSRTIRREAAVVACANGAHGRVAAGALFETLGWHELSNLPTDLEAAVVAG